MGEWSEPLVGIPASMLNAMERHILCPGFCGWAHRVDMALPDEQRVEDAWDKLTEHLMNCARGHAVFNLLRQMARWSLDNIAEDPYEYFGGKTKLYTLDVEHQAIECVKRAYLGQGSYDDLRHHG